MLFDAKPHENFASDQIEEIVRNDFRQDQGKVSSPIPWRSGAPEIRGIKKGRLRIREAPFSDQNSQN